MFLLSVHTFIIFSFPPSNVPAHIYLNQGNRCLLLTVEPDISATFAVEQLSYVLEKENHKIIVVVQQSTDKDQIYDFFAKSSIKERVGFAAPEKNM